MARAKRARGWCFTLFNFLPLHVIRLRELGRDGSDFRYVIFGRERCPETGKRHLQGYLYRSSKATMDGVKRILGDGFRHIHLEPAKGTAAQNREYCTKEADFEEFGVAPSQGRRNDLAIIKSRIDEGVPEEEIARDYFGQWVIYRRSFTAYRDLVHKPGMRTELQIYVLVGVPGVGKTRFVYEYARELGSSVYRVPDPDLKWFDGYRGEQVALIDDFRGCSSFGFLLQLLDIYPLRVPVKGGFTWWEPIRIFITSNDDVNSWFPEKDPSPLRRRLTRILHVEGSGNLPWSELYGRLKLKLNIDQ
jgi:hypothetical protein